ncbi:hypothetical protein BAX99_18880 [Elizabethkingia miricola]|nr:hypothetical protein BAX99_18880 [Elizabethkingia miricola]
MVKKKTSTQYAEVLNSFLILFILIIIHRGSAQIRHRFGKPPPVSIISIKFHMYYKSALEQLIFYRSKCKYFFDIKNTFCYFFE